MSSEKHLTPPFRLGFGVVSIETVFAVYQFSHEHGIPLGLLLSKNQVDYSSGYVCSTGQFVNQLTQEAKSRYHRAEVSFKRDHCGPAFAQRDPKLVDAIETLKEDKKFGIDYAHIDSRGYGFSAARQMIDHWGGPYELGTEEYRTKTQLEDEIIELAMANVPLPVWYVLDLGTRVGESRQLGYFNWEANETKIQLLHAQGICVNCHNGDYLSGDILKKMRGKIDSINVAPELATTQNTLILDLWMRQGLDVDPILKIVHAAGKWKRWTKETEVKPVTAFQLAAHYHRYEPQYRYLMKQFNPVGEIVHSLCNVINRYYQGFVA